MGKNYFGGKAGRGQKQIIQKSTGMADAVTKSSAGKPVISGGKSAYGTPPKGYTK